MSRLVFRALAVCTLGITSISLLAQECPPFSYGLSEVNINGEIVFISVARSRMIGNDGEAEQMAESVAEMKAKAKLQSSNASGEPLIGVTRQFICTKNQLVYVGVKKSDYDRKRAIVIQESINESIRRQPTLTEYKTEWDFFINK